jgi:hypothetical protein
MNRSVRPARAATTSLRSPEITLALTFKGAYSHSSSLLPGLGLFRKREARRRLHRASRSPLQKPSMISRVPARFSSSGQSYETRLRHQVTVRRLSPGAAKDNT